MQGSVRHTPRAAGSGDATSGLALFTFELTSAPLASGESHILLGGGGHIGHL